jgi:AAA15 family ATPase/GTPase
MSEHFIREIEIKKFKCFEDFRAEGFGRVNLIGGKNNVGKTAFMEAIYLYNTNKMSDVYKKLLVLKTYRNMQEMLLSNNRDSENLRTLILENNNINIGSEKKIPINLTEEEIYDDEIVEKYLLTNLLKIYQNEEGLIEYRYKSMKVEISMCKDRDTDENSDTYGQEDLYSSFEEKQISLSKLIDKLDINFNQTKYLTDKIFLISGLNDNKLLENIIGDLKLSNDNKYDELIKYLFQLFNIQSIDFIKDNPMIKVNDRYELLSSFGDGLKSTIFIIGSLLSLRNEYFYIDEIENGIHYSLLDNLWEIILTISEEQNVQVFATTHSKECIESFNRVQKELKNEVGKDTYYFEMAKNIKTDKIFMFQMDNEQLEYGLSHNERLRGE